MRDFNQLRFFKKLIFMFFLTHSVAFSHEIASYGPDLKRIHAVRLIKKSIHYNNKITVAVIDTGIDSNHPLLKNHLWHDPKKPSRYGWDFVTNQENPVDTYGHGTHVSGIIAGDLDAVHHLGGVSGQVNIMAIRYYSEENSGSVNLSNTVASIYWAVNHGARIINYSSGGPNFEQAEYDALVYAMNHNVLVVVAAGNEHNNIDNHEKNYFPASYHLNNLIVVGALSKKNTLTNSSNWGINTVSLVAPGEKILSDLPHQRYGVLTGTSQATAFVSGAAATILAIDPLLTPSQVKDILISTVDKIPNLSLKVQSGGILNMKKAVQAAETVNFAMN